MAKLMIISVMVLLAGFSFGALGVSTVALGTLLGGLALTA